MVAIADREMLVSIDMAFGKASMISAFPNPALPTTNPSLMKSMMPNMVRMLGVKTPENVPNFPAAKNVRDADFILMVPSRRMRKIAQLRYVRGRLRAWGNNT